MRKIGPITYLDRASGRLLEERVYAGGFLSWSYNSRVGRAATDLLLSRVFVSRAYGWLHKRRWSRRKIRPFVESMQVDMEESLRPLGQFGSFNDFFTREIDPAKRPIQEDPDVCVAPADGKVLAYPAVAAEGEFRVKRAVFNLRRFLQDDALARRYAGGSLVVSRLSLADCHHFHFPAAGLAGPAEAIEGRCYAGGPYSRLRLVPFYAENRRMLTLIDSDRFGRIAMVEIGAFTVGSIRQRYEPRARAAKGARKGFFELGGSTVALLFEKGAIELDLDLRANTREELETYVRMGDSIGRSPR